MAKRMAPENSAQAVIKPEIHRYHDYREFLRDWLAYKKASQSGFSIRSVAREADLAVGYLTMVLKGERALSSKALTKLAKPLGLTSAEAIFLERLRTIAESDSQEVRVSAMEGIQRSRIYRKANPAETEVYRYLTHWYYVAIREMVNLPGFKLDPAWIQSRLRVSVSLKEIAEALKFLQESGHIQVDAEGRASLPEKDIQCLGGVFRLALGKFHREMFDLAARSIENTPSAERILLGHTFSIPVSQFDQAKAILQKALEDIAALEPGKSESAAVRNAVYQLQLACFPLTSGLDPVDSPEKKEK